MKISHLLNMAAACALFVCVQSCTEDDQPNFVVPTPGPDKENTENGNGNNQGNGGNETQEPVASLCDAEHLGQKPMIIAYYTENSSALPDPACLTHINYAHGRFVDKETGDGAFRPPHPLPDVTSFPA